LSTIAEVSSQLLELYEQNRTTQAQSSQGSEAEGSSAGVCNQRSTVKSEANSKEPSAHGHLQASRPPNLQHSSSTGASGHHDDGQSNSDKHISGHKMLQNDNFNHGGSREKNKSGTKTGTVMDKLHNDKKFSPGHHYSKASHESHNPVEEHQPHGSDDNSNETRDGVGGNEAPVVSTSRMDAMNKIDKDKVKAALEKRRKSKGGFATKVNVIDDDDLLERELEQGVELAVEFEKINQDKKQNSSDGSMHPPDLENADELMENGHHVKQSLPTTAEDMGCPMDSKERHPPALHKQNDVSEHKSQQLDDTLKHQKSCDHPQPVGSPEQDGKDYKRPKLDG
jgi:cyclin T